MPEELSRAARLLMGPLDVTWLHPLMTVQQDREEKKWHFAAWLPIIDLLLTS